MRFLTVVPEYSLRPVPHCRLPEASVVIQSARGLLDAATKALDNTFDFTKKRAPLNQSYALSFGNQYSLWDRSLGVLASLSYNRSSSFYDDGIRTRWGGGSSPVSPMSIP